jgi:hypothetical protein
VNSLDALVGKRVVVKARLANFGGQSGRVTSIGNEKLPVHVTLDGDICETDFRANELDEEAGA